ncbi:MAG: dTDP-4-dehydrorhamnose reductase [Hyphomicrobiaceae bacterium]|nr:MAG: dTDP-4-dehydrorhamnose reductase [Hyphomicrobiaceae bacterium]
MKILVAGAQGQLARALGEQATRDGVSVTMMGRPQLDLCDKATIARAIGMTAPDIVVNAAAYTAVDKAEGDAAAAFAVNRDGAGALAAAARAHARPIIHVSTDYVFDGTKQGAYVEDDPVGPTGVYGRSKLEGEIAVAAANPQHVILRTAWVYSAHGHNFLKTIVRLARERPELRVVVDQRGNPTYAPHLADAILAIAAQLRAEPAAAKRWGIYHAAGTGDTSWYEFASAIIAAAGPLGVPQVPVKAISTSDYPTPARRPANSCLDCSKLARIFGVRLPSWRQGVAECIARLA